MSTPDHGLAPPGEPGAPAEPAASTPSPTEITPAPAHTELPVDLRAPWDRTDVLIFAAFSLGSAIVLGQVSAMLVLVLAGVPPQQFEKFPTTRTAFVVLHQALLSGAMMLYLCLLVRVRFREKFWRTIGWRPFAPQSMSRGAAVLACLLGGILLSIAVQFASFLVAPKTKLPMEAYFTNRPSVLMMMAMGVVVAPAVEETLFRGFLYPVLARSLGVAGGVLGTGVLFGMMHAAQLWGGWGQIGLLVVVGVVFTYVRARTGTVVATYFLHLGYNGILFLEFFLATGGLRHFPAGP